MALINGMNWSINIAVIDILTSTRVLALALTLAIYGLVLLRLCAEDSQPGGLQTIRAGRNLTATCIVCVCKKQKAGVDDTLVCANCVLPRGTR